jgi:hypothetical protein
MPCSYVIDKDRRLVVSILAGVFTVEDGRQHQQALSSDPDFNSEYCQLLDLTSVEEFAFDSAWVRQVAQHSVFSPRSRRAFLVNSAVAFGLTRMYGSYREVAGGEQPFRIFEDRDEAMRWLMEDGC